MFVRDKLWIWGHEADSHYGFLKKHSRMTPMESACYLGIPNLIMVTFGDLPKPPFDRHALALSPLKRVLWSIVGDYSSQRHDQLTDLDHVIDLAKRLENLTGAIMDDLFRPNPKPNEPPGRFGPKEIKAFRTKLHRAIRPLELWSVLYAHQLDLPVSQHLRACDGVTFWTWKAEDLTNLETNFERFEEKTKGLKRMLGCYMWDYGIEQPMPADVLLNQCDQALKWLRQRRIDGIIFLASCICDLPLEAVEAVKQWINEVGDTNLADAS